MYVEHFVQVTQEGASPGLGQKVGATYDLTNAMW